MKFELKDVTKIEHDATFPMKPVIKIFINERCVDIVKAKAGSSMELFAQINKAWDKATGIKDGTQRLSS